MDLVSLIAWLSVLLQLVSGEILEVNKCDGFELPYQVDLSNCTAQPCPLLRGSDAVVHIDFYAPHYIEEFSPQANATTAGITISYPLSSEKDGCSNIGNTRCPLEPEEYVSYTLTMHVLAVFPKISVQIVFYLVDGNGEVLNCFSVDTQVVDEL